MESHISLNFPNDAAKTSDHEEVTARTMRLSTGHNAHLSMHDEDFSSENYQILRELIHDL